MAFVWDTDVPVADVCRWLAGDGVQFGDDTERCAVARALAADLHEEWLRLASLWQKAPVVRAERHPAREPPGHQIRITPTPVVAQGQTSSPPAFRPMQESSPNMLRKVPSNEIRRQVRLESATAWAHQRKSSPPVRLDDDVRSSSSGSSPARAMNQPTRNEVVVRLANIFSTIVMSRLVPHVLLEVRFLVDLLLAPRRDRFPVQCPDNRLFNSTDDCLLFSGRALDTLAGIISHLGEKLTTLLVNCDAAKAHCPKLVTELAKMPTAERTNDFNEDDLLGVDETFRPSLDSRRMFKTPAQMRLYTNREQTRDLFMEALTSYRGSLGDRSDVRQIIDNCAPPNYHFLAGLFVNQLIQQCWNDRSWLPNKAVASSDPEKLRKMQRLARRVSAPSAVLTAAAKSVPLDSDSDTATESRFTGAEKFFFRLLRDSDHHRFSQLVRAHLANKVASLRATEDGRTARIVKLMTLGKFLGFITFSPFWVVDELQSPNAVKETSQILQSSRIGPFSLNQILRNALQRGALSLLTNVPWICEMLKMSSEASRATSEIQEAVSLLRQVPRQFNSSVGACVSVAIEELFLTLRLNLEPSTSIVDDIEDRHKRDRILFAASPHLEQALAALRKSSSSAVTAAPTRMITPSRNVVAPSSVTTTLRSAFFTCNSELASLVPLILDRVVPNAVELAIRSACDSAVRLFAVRNSDDQVEERREDALLAATRDAMSMSLSSCKERIPLAIDALAPRTARAPVDSKVAEHAKALAISHAADRVSDLVKNRLPEAFDDLWDSSVKRLSRPPSSTDQIRSPRATRLKHSFCSSSILALFTSFAQQAHIEDCSQIIGAVRSVSRPDVPQLLSSLAHPSLLHLPSWPTVFVTVITDVPISPCLVESVLIKVVNSETERQIVRFVELYLLRLDEGFRLHFLNLLSRCSSLEAKSVLTDVCCVATAF